MVLFAGVIAGCGGGDNKGGDPIQPGDYTKEPGAPAQGK